MIVISEFHAVGFHPHVSRAACLVGVHSGFRKAQGDLFECRLCGTFVKKTGTGPHLRGCLKGA